jgi:hypothetical protein
MSREVHTTTPGATHAATLSIATIVPRMGRADDTHMQLTGEGKVADKASLAGQQ